MKLADKEPVRLQPNRIWPRATSDERLLLDYAKSENPKSFDQLVERFDRELFTFLRRYLGSEHLAEDALQGTFLLLHRKCGQFDSRRKLRPWLYRIATNQANDLLRRNRRHRAVSLETELQTKTEGRHESSLKEMLADCREQPGDAAETAEMRQKVNSAVRELPDWLRQPIQLIVYEGFKYREAAEMLGIPLGTLKSRLSQAIRRLAEMLERPARSLGSAKTC